MSSMEGSQEEQAHQPESEVVEPPPQEETEQPQTEEEPPTESETQPEEAEAAPPAPAEDGAQETPNDVKADETAEPNVEEEKEDQEEAKPEEKKRTAPEPVPDDDPNVTPREIAFNDLKLERPTPNTIIHATIMEKITQYWPNSKQIRVRDSSGDARSIFFYVDDPAPNFSYDDLAAGNILVIRRPKLHFFMDGQIGMRIEEKEFVSITIVPKSEQPADVMLQFAQAEKDSGTGYFKDSKWDMAVDRYEAGVRHLDNAPGDEELAERKANLGCTLHSNIALCLSKQNKLSQVVESCKQAIMHKENAKAYFRMATAQEEQRELDLAEENFGKALQLEPSDSKIKSSLNRVRKERAKRRQQEAKMWGGMYASTPSSPTSSSATTSPSASTQQPSTFETKKRVARFGDLPDTATSTKSSWWGMEAWQLGVVGTVGVALAVGVGVWAQGRSEK
eukprot:TRINITY_DN61023_c0_g1_i1.p2 TRINITY_DN61023_c0_g1~~TRINITY_DN61023_c0_g1_i1.p2  ORF type:complete len:449 (-),score=88.44 TRINITY_DN61023_c0_g1_i1:2042-3388(-)